MIDVELIKHRKAMYGDNFKCIGIMWECKPKEVCRMMANMKQCRINAIEEKLSHERDKGANVDTTYVNDLQTSLYDSKIDRKNYLWISDNWEEYNKL